MVGWLYSQVRMFYYQFWPWGQCSRSNVDKTLFLNENPYFLLLIWKEREISRQKWPAEKWFLWSWKGKKWTPNVWETTRCPFSEFSWFFGVNKRLRRFTKGDETPETWEASGTHDKKAPQMKQNLLRPRCCFWVTLKLWTKCLFVL